MNLTRFSGARPCLLVLISCDRKGHKHFLAIEEGLRESPESWRALLLSLRDRGLKIAPKLAIGDGAMGFWAALRAVYPQSRHQRCWVLKSCNVLDKLPKSVHPETKSMIHAIWQADAQDLAEKAFDRFLTTFGDRYPKVTKSLRSDRDKLLAFYDFPAAHWQRLRTTNPIESTFATIRLRTHKTCNFVAVNTGLALMHRLAMSAQKR